MYLQDFQYIFLQAAIKIINKIINDILSFNLFFITIIYNLIHTQWLPREVAPILTAMWIVKYKQNRRYKIEYIEMASITAQWCGKSSWTVFITKYIFIVITITDNIVATILLTLKFINIYYCI